MPMFPWPIADPFATSGMAIEAVRAEHEVLVPHAHLGITGSARDDLPTPHAR
jgi:hypothetical protein